MHSMKDDWAEMGPGNCPKWNSIKKPYDEPMPAYPEQPVEDNIVRKCIQDIDTNREWLVARGFEKCGYSKDWVVGNIHRISVKSDRRMTPNCLCKTSYFVDGIKLFDIIDSMTYDLETYQLSVSSCIEFIAKESEP